MKLRALVKKELVEIFRQRELVVVMILVPVLQIILLGYVITTDINRIPLAIVNHSTMPASAKLIHRIRSNPVFDVKEIQRSYSSYQDLLKRRNVAGVIVLKDREFSPLFSLDFPRVMVLMDGADSNTAMIAAGYITGLVKHAVVGRINELGVAVPFDMKTVIRFNPELKSIFFMGPGIVAVILTIMTGFFAVVSVVREREQQTMDLLLSSRLGPLRIYIGKVIPPAMIGMVEMVMGILLVALWFNVPVRGGYMDLMITSLIFLPAIVSYSLLISIFSSTQQQAMFFGWFSMVTFLLLSGFFTPLRNIPAGIRFLADINPLRYYIHIIREIFLKGNGIACFWDELLVMAVITLVISSISVYVFYRRYVLK